MEILDTYQAKYHLQQGNLTDLEVCLQEDGRWGAFGVKLGELVKFGTKTSAGYRPVDYRNVQKIINFILKISALDTKIKISVEGKVDGYLKFNDNDVTELCHINAIRSVFAEYTDVGIDVFIRLNDKNKTTALVCRKVHEKRKEFRPYNKKSYAIRYMSRIGINLSLLEGVDTMERREAERACADKTLQNPRVVLKKNGRWEPIANLGDIVIRFFPPNQCRKRKTCSYVGAAAALGYLMRIGFKRGQINVETERKNKNEVNMLERDAVSLYAVRCISEPAASFQEDGSFKILCNSLDGQTSFNVLSVAAIRKDAVSMTKSDAAIRMMKRVGFKEIPDFDSEVA